MSGTKKWITNGNFCDYFVTGVKTKGGFSMLLIERQEGLETTQIKTSYSTTAGTAFIKFDNVKVPVENLLGVEDQGFKVIMTNFNHERWMITTFSVRSSRMVVEECLKWANQRRVFGKKLIEEPVIRQKYDTHIYMYTPVRSPALGAAHESRSLTLYLSLQARQDDRPRRSHPELP
jgi:alkylation response protein AidB-like acyl-CoA dehydrogenase